MTPSQTSISFRLHKNQISVKPPLKWAGGKRWLVPHLQEFWSMHQHRRLVEPFCGGLAITLGLLPDEALLNDINVHAINFYQQLKKGLNISKINYRAKIALQLANKKSAYYRSRTQFNNLVHTGKQNTAQAAALFYYLNRTGYNGLCRFNRQGKFNVPFGRYTAINYTTDFTTYKNIFAGWKFTSTDFEEVEVDRHDFIYADPPYDVDFTRYSKEGFSWQDQVRLAKWLAAHKGPVILSNQATDRVLELYKRWGFAIRILHAPRMISCTGDRSKAREVLAFKGF